MTYEEFKKELYRNVCNQEVNREKQIYLLEKGTICTNVEELKIIKSLNLHFDGNEEVVIQEDIIYADLGSEKMQSVFYWKVRPLYERLKKEGWQSVLPEIIAKLQETEMRERYIIRPVNFKYNMAELENCIYWKFGDIALVLYALIFDDGEDYITMKVNREITESWKLSDEMILTNALLNTYKKIPPRFYIDETDGLRGYRITTTRGINGAIAFFYPEVREKITELLGGDYYVGFVSIHEAVVFPVKHKILGKMKAVIQHANAVCGEKEILTNRIYRYSVARKELMEI